MLFDTSIKDKDTKEEINASVGKPYNVLDMFFRGIGQVGSSRMEILEHSKLFDKVMRQRKQAVFANIAIRPKGIIVVFFVRTSNYSWVIPFQYLSIIKNDTLVIHGQGEFLKLKITRDQNREFIEKTLRIKNHYSSNNYYGEIEN